MTVEEKVSIFEVQVLLVVCFYCIFISHLGFLPNPQQGCRFPRSNFHGKRSKEEIIYDLSIIIDWS